MPNFPSRPTVGPRMMTLLGSCALVLTGRALGLDWLAAPVFGVPSGLWAVGIAMLLAQHRHQRRLEESGEFDPGVLSARLDWSQLSLEQVRRRLPTADQVTGILEMVGVPAQSWDAARKRLDHIASRLAPAAAAGRSCVRIGIDLCDSDAETLMQAGRAESSEWSGTLPVEWVRVRAGLIADVERDLATMSLDALVRCERRGDLNVFIPESSERPAAWYDWSGTPPLGYASVFPPRVDGARFAVAPGTLSQMESTVDVARLILAAAMLGRSAARVGAGRRLIGRTELPLATAPGGPVDVLMRRLGSSVERFAESRRGPAPSNIRIAARVVSAWMTRSECACEDGDRVAITRAAAEVLGDEPEMGLRAAAVEFAFGDHAASQERIVAACSTLRREQRVCESDPLAFIMSEVELGSPGRMTLGRIAAAIGLLWATSPESNQPYLRDDLMDDLSHAGWLSDRAADVQVLQSVVDALQAGAAADVPIRARAA